MNSTEESLHFRDGVNRIDMVLTYPDKYARIPSSVEEQPTRKVSFSERAQSIVEDVVEDSPEEISHRIKEREFFEKHLKMAGLKTETEAHIRNGETTHFLKISAPWAVLSKQAEILRLRMPIKVRTKKSTTNNNNKLIYFTLKLIFRSNETLNSIPKNFLD